MQNVKPPKSCCTLQGYEIVDSDTLSHLVTSSTLCIQYRAKRLQLYQIDTSRAGLKEYLNLYATAADTRKSFLYHALMNLKILHQFQLVDSIQNCYGQATGSNVRNLKATQDAVWAIYYHIIDGLSEESLKLSTLFDLLVL